VPLPEFGPEPVDCPNASRCNAGEEVLALRQAIERSRDHAVALERRVFALPLVDEAVARVELLIRLGSSPS
jgi:hypothetical protein